MIVVKKKLENDQEVAKIKTDKGDQGVLLPRIVVTVGMVHRHAEIVTTDGLSKKSGTLQKKWHSHKKVALQMVYLIFNLLDGPLRISWPPSVFQFGHFTFLLRCCTSRANRCTKWPKIYSKIKKSLC